MADKRPEQALKAVTELASVAASAPAGAAMAVRPGNVNDWQPGWQQAEWLPLQRHGFLYYTGCTRTNTSTKRR
ncbi:MAG: hypothetical protein G5702_10260 [Serratia symbiotica]|nr:hypothetical protein [Serratia symbiotica]